MENENKEATLENAQPVTTETTPEGAINDPLNLFTEEPTPVKNIPLNETVQEEKTEEKAPEVKEETSSVEPEPLAAPVEETPVVEETPAVEDAPATEEAPAVESAPEVKEETPEETPAAGDDLLGKTVNLTLDEALVTPEPVLDEPVTKPKKEKKKGKGKGLLVFLLFILILAGVAAFVYFKFVKLDSKTVYNKIFKAYRQEVSNVINDNITPFQKGATIKGEFKITSNMPGFMNLKDVAVTYESGFSVDNKVAKTAIGLKEQGDEIVTVNGYLMNEKLYVKADKILDKTLIASDIEGLNEMFDKLEESLAKVDLTEYKYVVDSINKHLTSALNKATYSSSTTQVTINGKNTPVNDNVMVIDNSNINDIISEFLKLFKSDSKLLEILAKNLGVTTDSIVQMLPNNPNAQLEKPIKVNVYTTLVTNELVKIHASYEEVTFDVVKTANNTYSIKVSDGKETYEAKYTKVGKKSTLVIDIEGLTATLEYEAGKGSVSFNYTEGENFVNVAFTYEINSNTIEKINVDGAVRIEDLTSEDALKMAENIDKAFENSVFYDAVSEMFGGALIGGDVPAACEYATCEDQCVSETCTCKYFDTDSFEEKEVVCPNPNYTI